MITRSISAFAMLTIVIGAIGFGSPYFEGLIIIVGIAATVEWIKLITVSRQGVLKIAVTSLGVIYILAPCLILVWLNNNGSDGKYFIIWFFSIIWSTDVGAYLFGKFIGGYKLAPKISPNKTWAGSFGGVCTALLTSWLIDKILYSFTDLLTLMLLTISLSVTGQVGDLIVSIWKRKLEVKDTGKMIPGHGGILDRIDSTLLSSPIAGIIAVAFQVSEAP